MYQNKSLAIQETVLIDILKKILLFTRSLKMHRL